MNRHFNEPKFHIILIQICHAFAICKISNNYEGILGNITKLNHCSCGGDIEIMPKETSIAMLQFDKKLIKLCNHLVFLGLECRQILKKEVHAFDLKA